MKVFYKNIKVIRKHPEMVDWYYQMDVTDFYSDEDIQEMRSSNVKWHILNGRAKRENKTLNEYLGSNEVRI